MWRCSAPTSSRSSRRPATHSAPSGPTSTAGTRASARSLLDLKLDADRGVLHGLVAGADVVVENFRPGVAERLGCSQEQLRAVRPDLVTVRSPGYGDDESMAHLAAFDPLLQALGGIMDAQGGDGDPVFLSVPVHDAATPLIAAFGVVAALWHRARGGPGQEVLTSLVRTTTAVQAAEMVRYDGRPATARGGFDFRGDPDGAGGGYVETGTGWVWREPLPADADEGTPPDVPVCTVGFVGSPHAAHGGHVAEHPDTEWGLLHQVGQLVAGAGPQPTRAPRLDEHRDELLAEARAAAGAPRPAPPDPPDLPG
ncbi:MAG TPA: hypothetical protein DEP66_05945 [Acidimicrobiaceae bacterium]|nr:hypothetical protein [Acidimicrobiaceae bacterium]